MAVGVIHDDLLVRTGLDHYNQALARPHARPMDFTGRPSRSMVMVAPEGQDDSALRGWVELGISVATSLPAKPSK